MTENCECSIDEKIRRLSSIIIRGYSPLLKFVISQMETIGDPIMKEHFIFYKMIFNLLKEQEVLINSDLTFLKLFVQLTILLLRSFFLDSSHELSTRKRHRSIAEVLQEVLSFTTDDKDMDTSLKHFYLTMEVLEWFSSSNLHANSTYLSNERTFLSSSCQENKMVFPSSFCTDVYNSQFSKKSSLLPASLSRDVSYHTNFLNRTCNNDSERQSVNEVETLHCSYERPRAPGPFDCNLIEHEDNQEKNLKDEEMPGETLTEADVCGETLPEEDTHGEPLKEDARHRDILEEVAPIKTLDQCLEVDKSLPNTSVSGKVFSVNDEVNKSLKNNGNEIMDTHEKEDSCSKAVETVNFTDIHSLLKKCENFLIQTKESNSISEHQSQASSPPATSGEVLIETSKSLDLPSLNEDEPSMTIPKKSNSLDSANLVSLSGIGSLLTKYKAYFMKTEDLDSHSLSSMEQSSILESIGSLKFNQINEQNNINDNNSNIKNINYSSDQCANFSVKPQSNLAHIQTNELDSQKTTSLIPDNPVDVTNNVYGECHAGQVFNISSTENCGNEIELPESMSFDLLPLSGVEPESGQCNTCLDDFDVNQKIICTEESNIETLLITECYSSSVDDNINESPWDFSKGTNDANKLQSSFKKEVKLHKLTKNTLPEISSSSQSIHPLYTGQQFTIFDSPSSPVDTSEDTNYDRDFDQPIDLSYRAKNNVDLWKLLLLTSSPNQNDEESLDMIQITSVTSVSEDFSMFTDEKSIEDYFLLDQKTQSTSNTLDESNLLHSVLPNIKIKEEPCDNYLMNEFDSQENLPSLECYDGTEDNDSYLYNDSVFDFGCINVKQISSSKFIFKCCYVNCCFTSHEMKILTDHIDIDHCDVKLEWTCSLCDGGDYEDQSSQGLFEHVKSHLDPESFYSSLDERYSRMKRMLPLCDDDDDDDIFRTLRNKLLTLTNCFQYRHSNLNIHSEPNSRVPLDDTCDVVKTYGYLIDLFKCMLGSCQFSCNDLDLFVIHTNSHMVNWYYGRPTETNELVYHCRYCSESIANPGDHIVDMHGSAVYQCPFCCFRAYSALSVVVHEVCHESYSLSIPIVLVCAKKYRCSASSFLPTSILKQYRCFSTDCIYASCITSDFVNHLWTHSLKMLTCFECGAKLYEMKNFFKHLLWHGIGKYHCAYCSACYLSGNDAIKHVLSDHNNFPSKLLLRHNYDELKRTALKYFSCAKPLKVGFEKLTELELDSIRCSSKLYREIQTQKRGKPGKRNEADCQDITFNCPNKRTKITVKIFKETPPIHQFYTNKHHKNVVSSCDFSDGGSFFELHSVKDELDVYDIFHSPAWEGVTGFSDTTTVRTSGEVDDIDDTYCYTKYENRLFVMCFKCFICFDDLYTLQGAYEHFLTHHKESPFQFTLKFNNHSSMYSNILEHFFICYYCNMVLNNEDEIITHFQTLHGDEHLKYSSMSVMCHCPFCDLVFPFISQMVRHCFNMHERIYPCDFCNSWHKASLYNKLFVESTMKKVHESGEDILCPLEGESILFSLCYSQSENHCCEKFISTCIPTSYNNVEFFCKKCCALNNRFYDLTSGQNYFEENTGNCLWVSKNLPEITEKSIESGKSSPQSSVDFPFTRSQVSQMEAYQSARNCTTPQTSLTEKDDILSYYKVPQTARKSTCFKPFDMLRKRTAKKSRNTVIEEEKVPQTARKSTCMKNPYAFYSSHVVDNLKRHSLSTINKPTARKSTSKKKEKSNLSPLPLTSPYKYLNTKRKISTSDSVPGSSKDVPHSSKKTKFHSDTVSQATDVHFCEDKSSVNKKKIVKKGINKNLFHNSKGSVYKLINKKTQTYPEVITLPLDISLNSVNI